MANNKKHPYVKESHDRREKTFRHNLDTIVQMMDSDPIFYGLQVEVDFRTKAHRTPTVHGTVMYYLSSSRWQWKTEVHLGGPELFVPWLANLIETGKSNRKPEKTTRACGVIGD